MSFDRAGWTLMHSDRKGIPDMRRTDNALPEQWSPPSWLIATAWALASVCGWVLAFGSRPLLGLSIVTVSLLGLGLLAGLRLSDVAMDSRLGRIMARVVERS